MIDEEPSVNDSSAPPRTLRVGMVGYSFDGRSSLSGLAHRGSVL